MAVNKIKGCINEEGEIVVGVNKAESVEDGKGNKGIEFLSERFDFEDDDGVAEAAGKAVAADPFFFELISFSIPFI